jgi:hypothetical protein
MRVSMSMKTKKTEKAALTPSERVVERMTAHKPLVRQAALARDLGVTPTSVVRWFRQLDEGVINDAAWSDIARMLSDKYSIDVTDIRPVVPMTTLDTSLMPYLDAFEDKAQLEALIKILEGSHRQEARSLLIVLARDRLARQ